MREVAIRPSSILLATTVAHRQFQSLGDKAPYLVNDLTVLAVAMVVSPHIRLPIVSVRSARLLALPYVEDCFSTRQLCSMKTSRQILSLA